MTEEAFETCLILIAAVLVICGLTFGIGVTIKSLDNAARLDAIEARLDAEAR